MRLYRSGSDQITARPHSRLCWQVDDAFFPGPSLVDYVVGALQVGRLYKTSQIGRDLPFGTVNRRLLVYRERNVQWGVTARHSQGLAWNEGELMVACTQTG